VLDRAPLVAASTLVAAIALTALRLNGFGRDPSAFVVPGRNVLGRGAPPVLHPRSEAGYDGQFFYRLARAPGTTKAVDGISLDYPAYRHQRIGYPLLVWLSSLGGRSPRTVIWALIAVNVAALAVLGGLGALLAQASGRHAAWGLVLPAYPGFALTLARDLAEIVSICFLAVALLLYQRGRPVATALALTAAMLCRETTLVLAVGFALAWAGSGAGRERRDAVPFAVPLGAFALWQLVNWAWFGALPVLDAPHALDLPFVGIKHLVTNVTGVHGLARINSIEALLLLVGVITVAAVWRAASAPAALRWAWLCAAGLLVVASPMVWVEDWAFMRGATEFAALTYAMLLSAPPSALAAVGVAQVAVAAPVWQSLVSSR
jgi:hypothetical protein